MTRRISKALALLPLLAAGAAAQDPNGWHKFGERNPAPLQTPPAVMPASLYVSAGKTLWVETNNYLSSDRNQAGDAFAATLVEPLIAGGFVVAHAGQVVIGKVTVAEKSAHKTPSELKVELNEVALDDGQQISFKAELVETQEGKHPAVAVEGGALTNGGKPTTITPKSLLAFRIESPVAISTVHSGHAFAPAPAQDSPPQLQRPN